MHTLVFIGTVVLSLLVLAGLITVMVKVLSYASKKEAEHRKECQDWVCKLHSFGLNLIGLIMVGRILYHMGNPITALRYGRDLNYDYAYQGWTLLWWLTGIIVWSIVIIGIHFIRAFYRHQRQQA